MSSESEFALFVQNRNGAIWREYADDLAEAGRRAQELATREGVESFVYSFKDFREKGRYLPLPSKTQPSHPADK